jgi:TetR/AcrR family transcriptional regulator, transcriptional repressor for nem operon
MPYPSGHRDEMKKKIVASARRLFNRHGFENVSVDRIMSGAGLTRGGFYSYFESKSELYTEVLGCFFTDPEWKSCWEGVEVDLASADVGPQVVRAYLSRQHFEDVENSCPMAALPGDVTRSGVEARRAFETVFKAMVSVLERSLQDGASQGKRGRAGGNGSGENHQARSSVAAPRREQRRNGSSRHAVAQAAAALCVGGMVVARALENRALADELRDSCMAVAFELAGWEDGK